MHEMKKLMIIKLLFDANIGIRGLLAVSLIVLNFEYSTAEKLLWHLHDLSYGENMANLSVLCITLLTLLKVVSFFILAAQVVVILRHFEYLQIQ